MYTHRAYAIIPLPALIFDFRGCHFLARALGHAPRGGLPSQGTVPHIPLLRLK